MGKNGTALIVDDMALSRRILSDLLRDEYDLLQAENGKEALDVVKKHASQLSIILLDIMMPVMDGFQVMAYLKKEKLMDKIPVVLITADISEQYVTLGHDMGACDVIHKPFNPHVIKRRIHNLVELYAHKNHLEEMVQQQTRRLMEQTRMLTEQARRLTEINDLVIDTLSTVIEYRSLESGQHIRRIRAFTKLLLEHLAQEDDRITEEKVQLISSASAMHDIGKIAMPDSVLLKPGRLTQEEFEVMKTHTIKGCEILEHLNQMEDKDYLGCCYAICLYHHERWDGRGYPDGLAGDAIPLSAQVVSIADVYDALTNKRVYKPAYTHDEAVRMILQGECGAFSPRMLQCFTQAAPQFKELSRAYADRGN